MAQFFNTPAEAVEDIRDGASIAAHIWRLSGTPAQRLLSIRDKGIKDITLIVPNLVRPPGFTPEEMGRSMAFWEVGPWVKSLRSKSMAMGTGC